MKKENEKEKEIEEKKIERKDIHDLDDKEERKLYDIEDKKKKEKKEDMKVENWLNEARKNLKKVDKNSPMKLRSKKVMRGRNSTPESSRKGRKILDGERNLNKVNDIRKLWEKNIDKVDDEKKRKIDKKISNKEEISNQKVRNLIHGLQLDTILSRLSKVQ